MAQTEPTPTKTTEAVAPPNAATDLDAMTKHLAAQFTNGQEFNEWTEQDFAVLRGLWYWVNLHAGRMQKLLVFVFELGRLVEAKKAAQRAEGYVAAAQRVVNIGASILNEGQ